MIAYMILTRRTAPGDAQRYGDRLRLGECASLAPVVADAYQNLGIGTQVARHVLSCAKDMGLAQVILMGGVLATNERARRFYEKLGFRRLAGEFWVHGGKNKSLDMILEFRPGSPAA